MGHRGNVVTRDGQTGDQGCRQKTIITQSDSSADCDKQIFAIDYKQIRQRLKAELPVFDSCLTVCLSEATDLIMIHVWAATFSNDCNIRKRKENVSLI